MWVLVAFDGLSHNLHLRILLRKVDEAALNIVPAHRNQRTAMIS